MRANIEGQDGDYVKIFVHDNNQVEHDLTVCIESGEIAYHDQDGYPDKAAKRTGDGNEHVNQARRFAKYYVYRERGYDTLALGENPHRIEAVRSVLDALETEAFMEYFGEYYTQFESHYDPTVEPVIEQPIELGTDVTAHGGLGGLLSKHSFEKLRSLLRGDQTANLFYRQFITLSVNPSALTTVIKTYESELTRELESETEPTDPSFWVAVGRLAQTKGVDLADMFSIGTVSDLYSEVHDVDTESVPTYEDQFDREPDACLQHMPVPPKSPAEFQTYMDVHLRCQIRDCYLGMGVAAPKPYRITGPGLPEYIYRYERASFYQAYDDPEADIDWTQYEPLPDST